MRIAVCDDDKAEAQLIVSAIQALEPDSITEAFTNGAALLSAAKTAPGFDVAFLDIYMDGENGVEVASALRLICPNTPVVFVTTSREHAVEAFSLDALHYLVKPVTLQAVKEVFSRLEAQMMKKRPMIVLQNGQVRHSLYQDEIRYIQSADHATDIYTEDGSVYRARLSIGEVRSQLDGRFLLVQRGVVVNMDNIRQMNVDYCVLRNGVTFMLSRKDKLSIRAAYNNYTFGQLLLRDAREQEETP